MQAENYQLLIETCDSNCHVLGLLKSITRLERLANCLFVVDFELRHSILKGLFNGKLKICALASTRYVTA